MFFLISISKLTTFFQASQFFHKNVLLLAYSNTIPNPSTLYMTSHLLIHCIRKTIQDKNLLWNEEVPESF